MKPVRFPLAVIDAAGGLKFGKVDE